MQRIPSLIARFAALDLNRASPSLPSVVQESPASGDTLAVPKGHVAVVEMPGTGWSVSMNGGGLAHPQTEIVGGKTRLSFRTDGFLAKVGAHTVRLHQREKDVNLTLDVRDPSAGVTAGTRPGCAF